MRPCFDIEVLILLQTIGETATYRLNNPHEYPGLPRSDVDKLLWTAKIFYDHFSTLVRRRGYQRMAEQLNLLYEEEQRQRQLRQRDTEAGEYIALN